MAMPKLSRLLIVIADGEHARFVRRNPDNALHTDAALDSISAHRRSAELGTDHPGAAFHSGSSAHHAMEPRHDPQALEKARFAQEIADQLNAAAERGEFEELIIVAPAHVLGAIRHHLDDTATSLLIGTLGKDLVKTPDAELWEHLRQWIGPEHRAER